MVKLWISLVLLVYFLSTIVIASEDTYQIPLDKPKGNTYTPTPVTPTNDFVSHGHHKSHQKIGDLIIRSIGNSKSVIIGKILDGKYYKRVNGVYEPMKDIEQQYYGV